MKLQLLTSLIYFIYLLLPGWLFVCLFRYRRNRFLLSYGFSFSLLIITYSLAEIVSGSVIVWSYMLNGAVFILTIATILRMTFQTSVGFSWGKISRNLRSVEFLFFVVVVLFCAYHILVGPYTEIPSDFWKHLARVRIQLGNMDSQIVGPSTESFNTIVFSQSAGYFLHAAVAHFLQQDPLRLAPSATLAASIIFLSSIYWFAIRLIKSVRIPTQLKAIIALLSALFTFLWLGTATFSFIRYYSYFPTIFNFSLFFVTIALFIDYLDHENSDPKIPLVISLFFATMLIVHKQEALFTVVMIIGLTLSKFLKHYFSHNQISSVLRTRVTKSFALACGISLLLPAFAFSVGELHSWRNTPHITNLGSIFAALDGLPIVNPAFRFWDTLGYFGVATYIWYLLRIKSHSHIDYFQVGMLIPIFTCFNPIYALSFLHLSNSSGLWRTSYLMPVPFVAATLLVSFFYTQKKRFSINSIFRSSLIIVLFLAFLTPISIGDFTNRTSRLPSISPVNNGSGAGLWGDLIEAVSDIQSKRNIRKIWTDQVTRFVLYASTRNQILWWTDREYFPEFKELYRQDFKHSDLTDTLLVINKRDGVPTTSALVSGHWPPDILSVSKHYPDDIEEFIKLNSDNFEQLWAADRISIYLMSSISDP